MIQRERKLSRMLKNWLNEVKMNGNPHLEVLLVGNKNDLEEERAVTFE